MPVKSAKRSSSCLDGLRLACIHHKTDEDCARSSSEKDRWRPSCAKSTAQGARGPLCRRDWARFVGICDGCRLVETAGLMVPRLLPTLWLCSDQPLSPALPGTKIAPELSRYLWDTRLMAVAVVVHVTSLRRGCLGRLARFAWLGRFPLGLEAGHVFLVSYCGRI